MVTEKFVITMLDKLLYTFCILMNKSGDGSIPELKTSQVALIVECLEGWSFVVASVAALPG